MMMAITNQNNDRDYKSEEDREEEDAQQWRGGRMMIERTNCKDRNNAE